MRTYKDNEIAAVLREHQPDDKAALQEVSKVVYEVHTKDGKVVRRTLTGNQMGKTLSMYQTTSNCIGFPASRDLDFAVLRSLLNRPSKLMSDYMEGNLDWFFSGQYNRPEWDDDKLVLSNWSKKFLYPCKTKARRQRLDMELRFCEKLHQVRKKK
jgi:hypothetical protein